MFTFKIFPRNINYSITGHLTSVKIHAVVPSLVVQYSRRQPPTHCLVLRPPLVEEDVGAGTPDGGCGDAGDAAVVVQAPLLAHRVPAVAVAQEQTPETKAKTKAKLTACTVLGDGSRSC